MPPRRRVSSQGPTNRGRIPAPPSALAIDVEPGGGGGDKFHPIDPVEAKDLLAPQIHQLQQEVSELEPGFRASEVVFEAKLLANYLSGTYFPTELVHRAGLRMVGTRNSRGKWIKKSGVVEQPTKTLLLAGTDESIDRLNALVEQPVRIGKDRLWESFVRIDEIGLTPFDRVVRTRPEAWGEGELFTWEAVLHPNLDLSSKTARRHNAMLEKWEAIIERVHGELDLDDAREVDGLTFLPVAFTMEGLSTVARFNPLRCIRIMPTIRPIVVPVAQRSNDTYVLHPPDDEPPLSPTRIAIFDGGIDETCPFVAPFVRQIHVTPELPLEDDILHGTGVTTTALYGYMPEGGLVPQPEIGIDHFRVLPLPKLRGKTNADDVDRELYWLLDRINEVVRNGNYPLVNLSIGPKLSVDEEGEPDRWTSTLDLLAREKSVLFVNAAGNDGAKPASEGLHRVQVPADMVNGLGVGACTKRADDPIDRCKYSSQGPGRWGARVQPAGVSFGGALPSSPFLSILPHGAIGVAEGTSFAAPLTTHGLSGLIARLNGTGATPELLRAFAIHFAERRPNGHDYTQIGHGRFLERYDSLWIGDAEEVTVVYRDELAREEVAGFLLPYPDDIPSGIAVHLRLTICVTAPVAASDSAAYTKAGFDVTFRPHREVFSFYDPEQKKSLGAVNVVKDQAKALELIKSGGGQSKMPAAKTLRKPWITEQGRREAGMWETSVQYRFSRLDSKYLLGPTVELKYIAREGGQLQKQADPLRFAMLATVRIVKSAKPIGLYSMVRDQFPLLIPAETVLPIHV
jgi:hypothetical protein